MFPSIGIFYLDDTLVSEINLVVTGKSKKDSKIRSSDLGDFYDRIELADNELIPVRESQTPLLLFQIIAGLVVAITFFFYFRK